jgi:hypothetical protein
MCFEYKHESWDGVPYVWIASLVGKIPWQVSDTSLTLNDLRLRIRAHLEENTPLIWFLYIYVTRTLTELLRRAT